MQQVDFVVDVGYHNLMLSSLLSHIACLSIVCIVMHNSLEGMLEVLVVQVLSH